MKCRQKQQINYNGIFLKVNYVYFKLRDDIKLSHQIIDEGDCNFT